jgi:hypothetical protein
LFVVSGILLIGFLVVQVWKQERATVPPRIFKNRNIWGCAMYIGFLGASFLVMTYYVCPDRLNSIIRTLKLTSICSFPSGSRRLKVSRLFVRVS